jgi:hypothetical protein
MPSEVLDPEREAEEQEPEDPETMPEEEPVTAPEPDTLPEEPHVDPPGPGEQAIA